MVFLVIKKGKRGVDIMDIDHKDSIFEETVLKIAYSSTYEKEYVIPAGFF